jgi:transcriptional regulator with XRE-family HTH domain
MTFAMRLKELRKTAALTQTELGAKAGISQAAIALLERGEREPSLATAQKLAAALGVSCTAFELADKSPPDAKKKRKK